jgi:7,8-dihydropterin-6-yl-methyl-4-(beta-D-ribofuranosyl)aminobenzene 5'-phosphate synthase
MCTERAHAGTSVADVVPRPEPQVEVRDPIALAPVDAVTLTTLVDNTSDLLLLDQGPVTRAGLLRAPGPAAGHERARGRGGLRRPARRARVPDAGHGDA